MKQKNKKYVGAIDQGTTSSRFVLFDNKAEIIAMSQLEHTQIYPEPGWVEHDPIEIRDKVFETIKITLEKNNINVLDIAAIGVTNQRETTVIWDPKTGAPYYNAIVWQDTRTEDICNNLSNNSDKNYFRQKCGLPLATYFSGPKIIWLLDNIKGLREAALRGEVLFGTIDTWLIWWLTGGTDGGVHITDVTNASRTMLMNLETLQWDNEILNKMNIPQNILPEIKSSSEIYGYMNNKGLSKDQIPIAGDLGDQQAAMFGQTCFDDGESKNTYGTGCFLLMNTGEKIVHSDHGLITTVAYKIGKQPAKYAIEGSVAIAGSLVQWFRDNLGLISNSAEIEKLAKNVNDNAGVYFVPAFSGLFAPHWRSDARGIIVGMTHYTNKCHIARAVLEATAFQTKEIFDAMEKDSKIPIKLLKVDGGMVVNELLMQFQADILNISIVKPKITETTVLGAAYAAGLAVGFWNNIHELKNKWQVSKTWHAKMSDKQRDFLYNNWNNSVKKTYN